MIPWLTAFAAVLLAAGTWMSARSAPAPINRFRFPLPPDQTLSGQLLQGRGPRVALSPDGQTLIYAATSDGVARLYRRPLDELEATPIPGTEGGRSPFFSPDGQWVGFVAGLELKKIALAGGPPITIADVQTQFLGASWGPDERIVFAGGVPYLLFLVSAVGGAPQPLTSLEAGEVAHGLPSFLPSGEAVLFTSVGPSETSVAAVSLDGGARHTLLAGSNPRYTPTGHLLFYREGTVWAAVFDADRLEVTGEPVPVVERVANGQGLGGVQVAGAGSQLVADYAFSQTGALVYQPQVGVPQRSLVWVDRQGREEPLPAPVRAYVYPRISPDGARLALDIRDQENDIWVWDLARTTLTRLTFNPGTDIAPAWSPDGQHIVFQSAREGLQNLYRQPADGTGTEEQLTDSPGSQTAGSFFPDGKRLVIRNIVEATEAVSVLSLDADRSVTPLIHTAFSERNGEVSPDARWLAYQSDESGRWEVYVRPLATGSQGRWQISTEGGTRPLWARSGRELFYLELDGGITVVPIGAGSTLGAGTPERLPIEARYYGGLNLRSYDVSPDGRRFVVIKEEGTGGASTTSERTELVVVLNWFEELGRRMDADLR